MIPMEEGQEYDEEEGACVGGGEEREDPGDRVRTSFEQTKSVKISFKIYLCYIAGKLQH